jgi:type I restriction enzyme R subunit
VVEIMKRETQVVDFWESTSKQKNLKSYIISRILDSVPSRTLSQKGKYAVKESAVSCGVDAGEVLFGKRNEIAQKLIELAYHIYGK